MKNEYLGEPIATLLVAEEGVLEIIGKPWVRYSTAEEATAFVEFSCGGCEDIYRCSLTDQAGRHYALLTILEAAPEDVQVRARSYCRCLRLSEG